MGELDDFLKSDRSGTVYEHLPVAQLRREITQKQAEALAEGARRSSKTNFSVPLPEVVGKTLIFPEGLQQAQYFRDKKQHHEERVRDFGGFLFDKQQQKVIHDIVSDAEQKQFRFAVLGAIMCPSPDYEIESFLPPSLQGHRGEYQSIFEGIQSKADRSYLNRYKRVLELSGVKKGQEQQELNRGTDYVNGKIGGFSKSPEVTSTVARLSYIISKSRSGKDISDWAFVSSVDAQGKPKKDVSYSMAQGKFNLENAQSWKELLTSREKASVCGKIHETRCFSKNPAIPTRLPVDPKYRIAYGNVGMTQERYEVCSRLRDASIRALSPELASVSPIPCQTNVSVPTGTSSLSTFVEGFYKYVADDSASQELDVFRGNKEILVTLDKKGSFYRSIEFSNKKNDAQEFLSSLPRTKIKFYNKDVNKVLQHLSSSNSAPGEGVTISCGVLRCVQFSFSNGDTATVSKSDAENFKALFE